MAHERDVAVLAWVFVTLMLVCSCVLFSAAVQADADSQRVVLVGLVISLALLVMGAIEAVDATIRCAAAAAANITN